MALQDFNEDEIEPDYLGKLSKECPDCKALYFESEKPSYNKCCKNGNIKLPLLKEPPEVLKKLFDYQDEQSIEFHNKIRALNLAFSFTSIGEKGLDKSLANEQSGNYVYRINNTIHHFMGMF